MPHVNGGAVLIAGALKEASGLGMPEEPQLPAGTSQVPEGGQRGSSLAPCASPAGYGEGLQPSIGIFTVGLCGVGLIAKQF